MMAQDVAKAKMEVETTLKQLFQLVEQGARAGAAAHVVEEQLFRQLRVVGRQVYGHFLALHGTGDVGEQFAPPAGQQVQRFPEPHARPLVTIFGEFTLLRAVYGLREGQQIEAAPLDARLQLPASKFSYLLQNWDQLVTTEQPSGQVSRIMELILGARQHVDSLERMSRQMAASAEEFSWSQPAPPAAEEGEILVESADGKGVPIRHAADATTRTGVAPSRIASGWRRSARCTRWTGSCGLPSKCWRRCFTVRNSRGPTIFPRGRGRNTNGPSRGWTTIPAFPKRSG